MSEELALLNRISDELNKDLDPDKMLRRVLNLTVAHFAASTGSIMLFDQDDRVSSYILQQEDLSRERASRIVGKVLTEGFAGWMFTHGQGDVIHDTHLDSRWVVYDKQPYDVRSVIGMPLRRRQRVIGILTLVHDEAHRFTEQNLSLLNAIAGQAAIALENARLFKQTEQERSKLSAIINSTQDAVLVTTPENHALLLNPAAQEMLQIEGRDWQDKPLTELTKNPDLLKLLLPDVPTNGEVTLPNGRTMWASVTHIPDLDKVTVLRDISPYKELDRMKRNFVVAFTHDLRTPLATVKGYVDLVRMDGALTELQEEDLTGIVKAANSMKSLVEDLLELSRLEQLTELIRETIDLEDIIQASLNYMRSAAKAKRIELTAEEITLGLRVEGNSVLLTRAISNFLDNAIKYTPRQGKIRLKLLRNNNQAYISVADNGPGIASKDLPRVFEKFFRARAEVDEDVPGTGLGLSIVKTIADQHHGQVWVESQPNMGSTFTLTLPLVS